MRQIGVEGVIRRNTPARRRVIASPTTFLMSPVDGRHEKTRAGMRASAEIKTGDRRGSNICCRRSCRRRRKPGGREDESRELRWRRESLPSSALSSSSIIDGTSDVRGKQLSADSTHRLGLRSLSQFSRSELSASVVRGERYPGSSHLLRFPHIACAHVGYLLKNDKRAVFTVASHAQRAADSLTASR
jgi:hypothetical protein